MDDLRWKISSLVAGHSNQEFIDLLFASIPRQHLEEMLRREKSVAPEIDTSNWLDRSRV